MASHASHSTSLLASSSRANRATASQGGNVLPFGTDFQLQPMHYAGVAIALLGGACLFSLGKGSADRENEAAPGILKSFFLFFYSSFLKPHKSGSKASQQDDLESFYKRQAGAYDATRGILLRGREDMLALVVAQLKSKADTAKETTGKDKTKRIWVDVSYLPPYERMLKLIIPRLAVVPAGTLKPWAKTSTSPSFSPVSTSSTSRPLFVRLLASVLSALAGTMSPLYAKTPASSDLRIMKMECLPSRTCCALLL